MLFLSMLIYELSKLFYILYELSPTLNETKVYYKAAAPVIGVHIYYPNLLVLVIFFLLWPIDHRGRTGL